LEELLANDPELPAQSEIHSLIFEIEHLTQSIGSMNQPLNS
jgi:hypothetical protein